MVIAKMLFLILFVTSAYADVMNLNEFMPTRLEDSKVIQAETMEFQGSSDFQNQDTDEVIFRENFRYGASEKLQLEGFSNQISGGKELGSGQIHLGGQYDLFPQLGISPMVVFPTGKGDDGIGTELRFNQSSTILGSMNTPLMQFHVNFDWTHTRDDEHYLYIVGLSYKYNDSASLIIDVLREEKEVDSNILELGTQYDVGSDYLIGIGGGVGFGDESTHWNGIVTLVKMVPL